jgi:hypothetical protein
MSGHRVPRSGALVPMLILLLAAPVAAQTRVAAASKPSSAATLKSVLRSLAAAQAEYRVKRGRYADSVEQLKLPPAPEVGVEVTAASATGWQGRAMHREQAGKSCVIFVGRIEGREAPRTEGDREMAGEDGVPLCDRMR